MIGKIRFIEPGNFSPYKETPVNAFTYNNFIRNPSTGLITLATIAKPLAGDVLMYSESISELNYCDIYDADIIFISINTFNAPRGYRIAENIRAISRAVIVFGGMHASLNPDETIKYGDYVLLGDGDSSIAPLIHAIEKKADPDFPGVVYKKGGSVITTGRGEQSPDTDTIPDRNLVYDYSRLAKKYDTLWPQVHASRGCPHTCSYCMVIARFGSTIRKRTPGNIVADIKQAMAFYRRGFFSRLNTCIWLLDDTFAHDREWAKSVLHAIIDSGIKCHFAARTRYETGFDDEILGLMKKAGFLELALGIEFPGNSSSAAFNKKSNSGDTARAIKNIQKHGIGVRGLFVIGAGNDAGGIGERIARYVKENRIHGALIQSMFFTPGTSAVAENNQSHIHQDWEQYCGHVVHYPMNLKPHELQEVIIEASRRIYSLGNLLYALIHYRWVSKVLFVGEYFWQKNLRKDLARELPYLKSPANSA